MSACKEFLKDLEYYCMVEDGLEGKKSANRKQYNFKRLLNEINVQKQDENIKARYERNITRTKAMVDKFDIVHNTGVESIISIIQNGALLSIEEMEKRDISFNFRISFRGINDEMHKYVFGTAAQGDPIYGLYEIKFKKEVEGIVGAQFAPQSYLVYGAEVLKDYFMDIKDWRAYVSEQIATTMDDPEEYLKKIPVHSRPEFLFENELPISYIEKITCVNKTAYEELVKRISKEFGENNDILKIIKVAGE